MIEVNIEKEDIYKHIYFITAMAQKQEHGSMNGALFISPCSRSYFKNIYVF